MNFINNATGYIINPIITAGQGIKSIFNKDYYIKLKENDTEEDDDASENTSHCKHCYQSIKFKMYNTTGTETNSYITLKNAVNEVEHPDNIKWIDNFKEMMRYSWISFKMSFYFFINGIDKFTFRHKGQDINNELHDILIDKMINKL